MEHWVVSLLHLVFFPSGREETQAGYVGQEVYECNSTEASQSQPWGHISGKPQTGKSHPLT